MVSVAFRYWEYLKSFLFSTEGLTLSYFKVLEKIKYQPYFWNTLHLNLKHLKVYYFQQKS